MVRNVLLSRRLAERGVRFIPLYHRDWDHQQDVVHVRDLHATVLHLLGIDHGRFAVKYQNLDMRLTCVEPARVVTEALRG